MKSVVVLTVFFGSVLVKCQGPEFRVLAPQFICPESSNEKDIASSSESITIGMQTRAGQRLTYRVQIFFTMLNGFQNQQHTLSVWRNIRKLETKIRDSKEEISIKDQIEVLSSDLTPDVAYTFNIVGVDEEGNESLPQNFSITYRGENELDTNQNGGSNRGDISFLLIGPLNTFANIPYFLQGVLIFCDPISDYWFNWKMPELPSEYSHLLKIRHQKLTIPPKILNPGRSYDISVTVTNGNESLAEASTKFNVYHRDFRIVLVPRNLSIGLNREVTYEIYLDNADDPELGMSIKWRCSDEYSNSSCIIMKSSEDHRQSFIFEKRGLYRIDVDFQMNNVYKTESAFVEVLPEIIASVEFLEFAPFEIVGGAPFSMRVLINNLIPECHAEWTSVSNVDGFSWLETEPYGIDLGKMVVNDIEENFLSELIEYENNTITNEMLLSIPGKMENFTGLIENKVYLFRLLITCPEPIDENFDGLRENITSFVDLILDVNQPPSLEPLEIIPPVGEALTTNFKFSAGPALDLPSDYPMRYTFMYEVEGLNVEIDEFYENTITSTELPFSKTEIKTLYKVCNSRNACDQVMGPDVQVKQNGNITNNDLDVMIFSIKGSVYRKDYNEMFRKAINGLVTFNNSGRTTFFKILSDELEIIIKDEISNLKFEEYIPSYVSEQDIFKFVKFSKIILERIKRTSLFSELISLLDKKENYLKRSKRSPIVSKEKPNVEKFDLQLEVTLSIHFNNKETDDPKLYETPTKDKLKSIYKEICKTLNLYSSYKFVYQNSYAIDIVRSQTNIIKSKNFSIPYEVFNTLKGYFKFLSYKETSEMCVVKSIFLDSNPIYHIDLIDPSYTDRVLKSTDYKIYLNLPIPFNLVNATIGIFARNGKSWMNDYCETIKSDQDKVEASCSKIGHFQLMKIINRPDREATTEGFVQKTTKEFIDTTDFTTPSPTTKLSTTTPEFIETITSTILFVSENSSSLPIKSDSSELSASTAGYAILGIVGVCAGIGVLIYLIRRFAINQSIKTSPHTLAISAITPRVRGEGIKYARFPDQHTMDSFIPF